MKKNIFSSAWYLMLARALFAAMTVTWVAAASGATYYVDKNHGASSDSNPGTASQPWKTIQRAVDIVSAGDTVYIKAGTYREKVALTGSNGSSGDSGNASSGYITYAGYPGHQVIMDGSTLGNATAFLSGKWAPGSRAMDYIKIQNLTIKNYAGYGVAFENDDAQSGVGGGSHHVVLEDLTISGCDLEAILFEGGTVARGETHDIVIRNCTAYNNGSHGIKFTGDAPGTLNGEHSRDCIIENCTSYGNAYIGIHISTGAYDMTIKNCTSYNNGRQGIAAHEIWDSLYEGNHVYSNGQTDPLANHGIMIWSSRNMTIRGNRIHDNPGAGLAFTGALNGSAPRIENNVISANGGDGVSLSSALNSATINHNTLALNQSTGLYLNSAGSGHVVKNNIMYLNSSQVYPGSGNTFDYNLWHPNTSFSGKGSHATSGDPLFVNGSGGDFHITSGSPAANTAVPVGLSVDVEGTSRPQGAGFDIGAYEMLAGSTAKPLPPSGLHIAD